MTSLRTYQQKLESELYLALAGGARRILLVMPTGGGKTTSFAAFIKSQGSSFRSCLVVAHRQELISQPFKRLREFGVTAGIVMAKRDQQEPLALVASIQTLARRKLKRNPDFIIIDEAHRAVGASYRNLVAQYPEAVILGFTATPIRTDGKFLDSEFDVLIQGPSIQELTDWEYLVPAICYGPQEIDTSGLSVKMGEYDQHALYDLFNKPERYAGVLKYWQEYAANRTTIVFCQSVQHSKDTCAAFQAAGVVSAHVDGETSDEERKGIFEALADGSLTVLCNYGIAVEGVDVPRVSCVVLDMATLSLSKFLQGVGRGLRTLEDKADCIVLDFGGNVKRHGFPSSERDWQLSGKKKKAGVAPVKECPSCYLLLHASAPACSCCGYVFSQKAVEVEEVAFTLLIPPELDVPAETMDVATLCKASQYFGGQKWLLQQLRIRTAEHLKVALKDRSFSSGADYAATKKQVGKETYRVLLQEVATLRSYSPAWVRKLSDYY